MNKLKHKLLENFKKQKTYRNFLIINIFIITAIIIVLTIKSYTNNKIEKLINDKQNRIINIVELNKNKEVIDYLTNNKKIENIFIDIYELNYKTENGLFNIFSYSKKDKKNENKNTIYISEYHNLSKITINNIEIENIIYIKDTDKNIIFCNQRLASSLLKKNLNGFINLKVKNYKDIDIILKELEKLDCLASHNAGNSLTINTYKNLNTTLSILFYIELILFITLSIYINFNIINEEERNVKIFNFLGYTSKHITKIYNYIILNTLLKIYIITLSLEIILFIFLKSYISNFLLISTLTNTLLTFIINLTINIIMIYINIIIKGVKK